MEYVIRSLASLAAILGATYIPAYKEVVRMGKKLRYILWFAGSKVIQATYFVALCQKVFGEAGADKAGPSGNQDGLVCVFSHNNLFAQRLQR